MISIGSACSNQRKLWAHSVISDNCRSFRQTCKHLLQQQLFAISQSQLTSTSDSIVKCSRHRFHQLECELPSEVWSTQIMVAQGPVNRYVHFTNRLTQRVAILCDQSFCNHVCDCRLKLILASDHIWARGLLSVVGDLHCSLYTCIP